MSKIRIKATILNNGLKDEIKTTAIVIGNAIKYYEKDNTLVKYDMKNNILQRENDNLRMEYDFKNNKGYYLIKEFNNNVFIEIKTKNIIRKNNDIKIEFYIEKNLFKYQIEEEI